MIDQYFFKVYNADTYNCLHFAAEVWQDLTGQDILEKLSLGFTVPASESFTLSTARHIKRNFTKLSVPESPSLAMMQRARMTPHVGVFFDRRILHITEGGVEFQPPDVASRGFKTVTYYRCNK